MGVPLAVKTWFPSTLKPPSAALACMVAGAQIDIKIRNATIKICIFFMLFIPIFVADLYLKQETLESPLCLLIFFLFWLLR